MDTPDPDLPVRASRLDAWLTRHRVSGTRRRDVLLAVVVAIATAVVLPTTLWAAGAAGELVVDDTAVGLLTLVCAAQCLLLSARRTRPVACLLLVAAVQMVVVAVTPPDVGARGPATLMAAYAVATVLPGRSVARAVVAAVLVELVGVVAVTATTGGLAAGLAGVAGGAVTYAGSALVGSDVRTRRRYVDLVRRRAADAQATQEARVRTAITDERTRMARELHDIAAHHLSGMVVQATATARLVDRDPEATREGLLAIRGQGRRTLEDLRLLVGVLRDPSGTDDGAPVPGIAVLDELVSSARDLGADVRVQRLGEPVALGPLADVTCYRLVQEALSNARQHAPGAVVDVELAYDATGLTVTVANDPPRSAPLRGGAREGAGVGLVGMRERVQLVGGRLEVGSTPAGGWRVRAQLPIDTEEAPS